MKVAAVAAFILLSGAGALAQERHHAAPPPAPVVPPVLSTQGATILPPPPPPSPFAARPGTYAPHYDRTGPPFRAGVGNGVSIYNGLLGYGPYVPVPEPAAWPTVATQKQVPAATAPEIQKASESLKVAEPLPEPAVLAANHGPDTFYVIPGCYAGNRPPIPERLPKGCDLAKLRTTPIR